MFNVKDIKDPTFIKDLKENELSELASEIRELMIKSVAKTGGYLASNLSVVELTIALHRCFDLKKDKVIFDSGYQSYAHKILTGRADRLNELHREGGISDYFDSRESEYDHDHIAYSLGLYVAESEALVRDIQKKDEDVVCVIGEETIMTASCLEALSEIGKTQCKMIIILNDNGDYRSRPTGSNKMHPIVNGMRESSEYIALKKAIKDNLSKTDVGKNLCAKFVAFKTNIRNQIIDGGIFSAFGINYYGPIDGHDMSCLLKAMNKAKNEDGPVIIHCLTKKGRGYELLENGLKTDRLYSFPFDYKTGRPLSATPKGYLSYIDIIALSLEMAMKKDEKIMAIVCDSDNVFKNIKAKFPKRIFEVGAHQEKAIAMAYAFSKEGFFPFVCLDAVTIYKYIDAINELIIRYDVPCIISLKNAGVLKEEGDYNQGIFDISVLNDLDVAITEGHDHTEIISLFYLGLMKKMPYFIRVPNCEIKIEDDHEGAIDLGSWKYLRKLDDYKGTIISYGPDLKTILKELEINDLPYQLVDARFIKPVDKKILRELKDEGKKIIIYSFDYHHDGLYMNILNEIKDDDKLINMAIKGPISIGSINQIRKLQSLDWPSINEVLKK